MKEKKYSVAEIKKLMRECAKARTFLQIGDLIIDCRDSAQDAIAPSPQHRGSAKKAKKVEEQGVSQEQFNIAKEISDTLHLEDPKGFEEMLIRGELEKTENH